ncbi:phosphopantetheine-binding protein [Streptococcus iniae]|uniref:phosphopantetheine-binding protein n=1 Tax=Streptococcus iniae TaxID=1346 RepID=UPI000EF7519A|nr:phosphopantetheine-binding protein [Streptococcus iniae]RLU45674.1 acyl carrier protein [Streptococcus iniae]
MTREMIVNQLISLAKEKDSHKDMQLSESSRLADDLLLDSIELMEYIVSIEDAFKVSIPDEVVEHMVTLSDLSDYLMEQ